MKIIVIGYTGSGKTVVSNMIAEQMGGKSIACSDFIISDFARTSMINEAFVIKHKHAFRDQLFNFARDKQLKDPLVYIRQPLNEYDVLSGVRNKDELKAAKEAGIVDLIVWVNRHGAHRNATDNLDVSDADIIIQNIGTLEELRSKIALSNFY